jgi:putative radical SAM enzyme (TIGR03279 family)
MPSFVGMGNLVDSLYAIKTLIFDKKELTFAQLKNALDNNFVGFEALRQQLLYGVQKYGNDDDDIDKYYGIITNHIISECKKHSCENKCVFCFIDQLPKGLRSSLYFKDDDSRLSFLHGNYVTLTNLHDKDVQRIIDMHISPVNVSVHTTNPELRVKMMKNKRSGEVLSYLQRLADADITLCCQIVLCKGLNDGEELMRTMHDLAALHPAVKSVSIVPAGMTKFREENKLYPLTAFSAEEAKQVIRKVETFAEQCLAHYGSRIFYVGDEFYQQAGLPIPDAEYYGDFHAIEDGVGMIASMKQEFENALADADEDESLEREISIATGKAAYGFLCTLAERFREKYPNVKIHIYEIENRYFGESVTVAGLLTGKDLKEQLSGKPLGETLYISTNMLRYEEDLFLCGMHIDELSESLGVTIETCPSDGYEFFDKLTGI